MIGRLVNGRWKGEDGLPGVSGRPGQGGGGGGATMSLHGNGGSPGGCGGAGGRFGKAGGSSLGVVLVRSSLEVVESSIETGGGGAPVNGAPGQAGQPGGPRISTPDGACYGGAGGDGGAGGAGGGAAGGSSIPVVRTQDSTLVLDGGVLKPRVAGVTGRGGKPGYNDGVPGIARQEFVL